MQIAASAKRPLPRPASGFPIPPPLPRRNSSAPVSPKRGRPCLLTKDRQTALLEAIEEGLPLKQAAMIAGVSYDTLNRWKKRGADENAPAEFCDLCQALEQAEAVGMQRNLANISNAGRNDWRASAWILERRYPESFGKEKPFESSTMKPAPVDCEVLRRIKQQNGVVEAMGRLGVVLDRVRQRRLDSLT